MSAEQMTQNSLGLGLVRMRRGLQWGQIPMTHLCSTRSSAPHSSSPRQLQKLLSPGRQGQSWAPLEGDREGDISAARGVSVPPFYRCRGSRIACCLILRGSWSFVFRHTFAVLVSKAILCVEVVPIQLTITAYFLCVSAEYNFLYFT